jgi:hypothetical protein
VQVHLPILLGGSGPKKTLPLVARSADMWNCYGTPEEVAAADATLRAACEAAGRDEREIERTVDLNVVIRGDRAAAEAAWAAWRNRHLPQPGETELDVGGSLDDEAAGLARYRDVGFAHPILIFRTPWTPRPWTACRSCGRGSTPDLALGAPGSARSGRAPWDTSACPAACRIKRGRARHGPARCQHRPDDLLVRDVALVAHRDADRTPPRASVSSSPASRTWCR